MQLDGVRNQAQFSEFRVHTTAARKHRRVSPANACFLSTQPLKQWNQGNMEQKLLPVGHEMQMQLVAQTRSRLGSQTQVC